VNDCCGPLAESMGGGGMAGRGVRRRPGAGQSVNKKLTLFFGPSSLFFSSFGFYLMALIALNESIPMPKAVKSCRKTYKSVTETHTNRNKN